MPSGSLPQQRWPSTDHTPIDDRHSNISMKLESCLYRFGCIEFPRRCNGCIRFPLHVNSCADPTDLLSQRSRHQHFFLIAETTRAVSAIIDVCIDALVFHRLHTRWNRLIETGRAVSTSILSLRQNSTLQNLVHRLHSIPAVPLQLHSIPGVKSNEKQYTIE